MKQYKNAAQAKHSKYKYIYYHNTYTIVKTPTHYKTHNTQTPTQNKLKQPQYKINIILNIYNTIKYPQ